MKNLLILVIILTSINCYSQKHLSEKDALTKSHIDFTKEIIYFALSGLIEIDGQVFLNDTSRHKIVYIADLDKITLRDVARHINYIHVNCNKEGCNIIHLIRDTTDNKVVVKHNINHWKSNDQSILIIH